MDVGAAHLAVVLPAGAARHQAVAEVDQTAEGDEGEKNGLLQADAMGAAGLLLQEAALAHLRRRGPGWTVRGKRMVEVAALELDPGSELAVFNRGRTFAADQRACRDDRLVAMDSATWINFNSVARDAVNIDLVADVDGQRVGKVDALFHQTLDLVTQCRPKFHHVLPLRNRGCAKLVRYRRGVQQCRIR